MMAMKEESTDLILKIKHLKELQNSYIFMAKNN